jgi:hypothetical protein
MGQGDQRRTSSVILTAMEENAEPAVIRAQKSGGSRLPPLVIPRRNHQAPWLFPKDLSSAALLTALLAAATFLAATAPLAAARLLPALALLALTFLFILIFLLATPALLSATALLAALLSSAFRFDGFIRITLCFHGPFLYFSY